MIAQIKMYTHSFKFVDATITAMLGNGIAPGGVFEMKDSSITGTQWGARQPGTYHGGATFTHETIHWSLQALQQRDILPHNAVLGFSLQRDGRDHPRSTEFYQQPLDAFRGQWVRDGLIIPEECILAQELGLWQTFVVLEEDSAYEQHARLSN